MNGLFPITGSNGENQLNDRGIESRCADASQLTLNWRVRLTRQVFLGLDQCLACY